MIISLVPTNPHHHRRLVLGRMGGSDQQAASGPASGTGPTVRPAPTDISRGCSCLIHLHGGESAHDWH